MKIFDCIIYLDEDLLLDLRFNILNNYVDYFVIVESDKTWQNNNKNFIILRQPVIVRFMIFGTKVFMLVFGMTKPSF